MATGTDYWPSASNNPYTGAFTVGGDPDPYYLALMSQYAQPMQDYRTQDPQDLGLPSYLNYPLTSVLNNTSVSKIPGALGMKPDGSDSPVAAAMAQPDPSADPAQDPAVDPSTQGGYGNLPPQLQALFQNQAQNPNRAMSDSLIASGSAMLGQKDLASGMSAGGKAFLDTYNGTVQNQMDLNTPKVTTPADGAFTMSQLPGQNPSLKANPGVQDFLMGKIKQQAQAQIVKAILTQQMRAQTQQEQQTREKGYDANSGAVQAHNTLQAMRDAMDVVKDDDGSLSRQFQANYPTTGALPAFAETSAKNAILKRVMVDQELLQGSVQKGAITKSQAESYKSDIPAVTDSNAKWRLWLTRNMPLMEAIETKNQALVNAGAAAGAPGLKATATPPAAPAASGGGSVPTLGAGDASAYQNLPSGAYFRDPTGTLRRKP